MDQLESKFFDLLLKKRESIDEQVKNLYKEREEVQVQINKLCPHPSISYREVPEYRDNGYGKWYNGHEYKCNICKAFELNTYGGGPLCKLYEKQVEK